MKTVVIVLLTCCVGIFANTRIHAQTVDFKKTAKYLDSKQSHWFEWSSSKRGNTRCIACHTNLTYTIVRHDLAKFTGSDDLAVYNNKLLTNAKKRIENWDTIRVFYGGRKKAQSRGTEAIMNALILAKHDRASKREKISAATKQAFDILWKHQIPSGDAAGGWHWLDFGLEPWESADGAYYGAAIAAIAIGTAPGYVNHNEIKPNLAALKKYLLKPYGSELAGNPKLSLYNRAYLLWASSELSGLLNQNQKSALHQKLFAKQNADGGWSLPSLGKWKRLDGTPQSKKSDGYATGLVVYAMLRSGVKKDNEKMKQAIAWLAKHQNADGSWTGISVNKDRTNAREPVKSFFTHAATAMSALALIESKK